MFYTNHIDVDWNQEITDSKKNDIAKALFATEVVDDVKIDYKNKTLNITIKERPFIRSVSFVGNKKLKKEIIDNNIKLKDKNSFSDNLLQQDLKFLDDFYRSIGLLNTKITSKVEYLDNNLVDVYFDIKEGKKARVKSIRFYGNKKFGSNKLREGIFTREDKFFRFGNRIVYNEEMLEYDSYLLSQFYYSKGYLEFDVVSKNALYDPITNTFDIIFKLKEGEKFNYGNVRVISNIKDFDYDFIEDEFLKFSNDKTFNLIAIRNKTNELNAALEKDGLGNIYINPQLFPDEDKKIVNIDVVLDYDKKQYVGKVTIKGNNKTFDNVIRKKLVLEEGSLLNQRQLNKSVQKVKNLGFFDDVIYTQNSGYFENLKDIDIEVKESSHNGYINFAVGYSTLDGTNGSIGLSQHNLFGRAIALNVDLSVYETARSFNFFLSKPEIYNTDMSWSSNIYYNARDDSRNNAINIGYDSEAYGFGNYLSFDLTENLLQRIGYVFEFERFRNISDDYKYILSEDGKYTSKITNGFYYDRRDNYQNPTNGYLIAWDLDIAGIGGDKDYAKNVFRFAHYYPLTGSIVFKSEFKAGFIKSIGNNPLFPTDGFYLGGYSMRGFQSGGIGPRVNVTTKTLSDGYGIGGTRLYYGNFELKFPLGLPKEFDIFGVLFLNFGTTTGIEDNPDVKKESIVDSGSLRSAYGLSIIWQTPMGNISFDFSKVLKKETYDISENFRFNVGTQF
jgi:outer membrane protein insertion porin family